MLDTKESIQLFTRRTFLILLDIVLVYAATHLALLLRFDLMISRIEAPYYENMMHTLPVLVIETFEPLVPFQVTVFLLFTITYWPLPTL